MEKADDKDEDEKGDDKMKTDIKKGQDGYVYETIKAERPGGLYYRKSSSNALTGAELMNAILKGWPDASGTQKHTNIQASFTEGWNRVMEGEFGTGLPVPEGY